MEKMESKEKSRWVAEYIERRNDNGTLEVMAYSGTMKVREDWVEKFRRSYSFPKYQRILVLPLPPDFDWRKLDLDTSKPNLPNSILIMEDRVRWKRKGRKRGRPLTAFLDRPGNTDVKEVTFKGEVGERSKVWIDREKFMAITKRNLYVDRFYAEQIFGIKIDIVLADETFNA
jgi:hypothetical protein